MEFRKALVTGATSGIGFALCELLAAKKIDLIVTGRDLEQLKILEEKFRSQINIMTIASDVSQLEGQKKLIDVIKEQVPDLVINNAGFGLYGDIFRYPTEGLLEILKVNGEAVLGLTIEAAKALKNAHKKGVILNVSSVAAYMPFPYLSVYAATKAFVNSISESLDFELQKKGIRVFAACPGQVATKFSSRASQKSYREKKQLPFGVMTSDFAAEQIWKQIEQKKRIHIFDWKYRLSAFLAQYCLPRALLAKILAKQIQDRLKP